MLFTHCDTFDGTSQPLGAALTQAFGLSPLDVGEGALAYSALNAYGSFLTSGRPNTTSEPKAFVTILVFDANYNLVSENTTWQQISDDAEHTTGEIKSPHEFITKEMIISQPGYAYVFLSNENPTQVDVYFDDVTFTHSHSPVVFGADYYPFGLPMAETEITDEQYRYGYQGQFSEENKETGWNEFELRMYDARIGRWLSDDPYGQYHSPYLAMGNAPHMSIDPDGGFNWGATAVGAVGGFAVGSLVGLAVDKDNWWKYGIGGAVIGGTIGAMQPDPAISKSASGWVEFRAEVEQVFSKGGKGSIVSGRNTYFYGRAATLADGPPAYFYSVVKHGVWNPKAGDWGKLDGHVFLVDEDGTDYSFRPTGTRNGKTLPPDLNKMLWHSEGSVGTDPGYLLYALSKPHDVYKIRTTSAKKRLLLNNIYKSSLNPPDYSFIGKRCAGWAMKMMRRSKIVGPGSKFHQYSPWSHGNYLKRRPGVVKNP